VLLPKPNPNLKEETTRTKCKENENKSNGKVNEWVGVRVTHLNLITQTGFK
jgi:hypothetical protein